MFENLREEDKLLYAEPADVSDFFYSRTYAIDSSF